MVEAVFLSFSSVGRMAWEREPKPKGGRERSHTGHRRGYWGAPDTACGAAPLEGGVAAAAGGGRGRRSGRDPKTRGPPLMLGGK